MKHNLLSFVLLFMLSIGLVNAQNRQLSGRVTDSGDGSPLANVSVRVVGASTATQTNAQGNYTLTVSENSQVEFSFIGYQSQTQSVTGRSTINVSLVSSSDELDEVVVVAYGTVKKSDFTGSATQIGSKEIDKRPISNVLTALQGAGPGIQTSTPSGAPGSSPTIRIRGLGSYSAGQGALVVVDGVPFDGGMANINPADVESVTVLKDAATIAMYGSRGANGVIMVTTKKGNAGKSELNVSAQYGFNENGVPAYNTVDAGQYYELMWQAYTNNLAYGSTAIPIDIARQLGSGVLPRNDKGLQLYNGKTYQDIVQYLGNYNAFDVSNETLVGVDGKLNPAAKFRYEGFTSWEDEASRKGNRNEYNVNYSGGFNSTDIYSSLNYLKDNGWGLRSSNERFQGRLNVNTKVTDWLKTGININAATINYNFAADGASSINNPFYFSRAIAPIYPVYVHDPATGKLVYDEFGAKRYDYGNLVSEFGLSRPFNSGRHAIAETMFNSSAANRDFFGARAYIDINILPWLTFSTTFSPDIQNYKSEGYENTIVGDGAPAGRYNQSWNRQLSYTFNQLLRANNTFGNHNLETVLGHEFYSYKYESIYGMRTGQGFQGVNIFENFTDISSLTSGINENTIESYFGRVNYNYNSKYYLSAMIRADGNSKFPSNLRWEEFWSLGAAWRLDQEDFFKNDYVNLLKLRASYGKLGNSDVGYYPYQNGYEIGYNNASTPGSIFASLGSDNLTWETQKPLDFGVDFSLFDNRLSGSFEYYYRNSDGLLFSVNQPYHNGGTWAGSFAVQQNVGAMTNKGIEATVTGNLIRKPEFNWNLTFNVTTVKNEITKMPVETPEIVSSPYKRAVGRSLYDFYTRTYYGVDPETGEALYLGLEDGVEFDPDNATHRLIDNGNGRVDTVTTNQNAARQSWLNKSALPPVYGSIINDFTYKNFDFRFVLTYSLGGHFYDGYYGGLVSSGPANGANLHQDLLNAWKEPGDITDVPRMDVGRTAQHGATSSRYLTKASYLNISAINVGYRIPEVYSNRIGIKRARVYASAENLFYWSAKKGFNPLGGITGPTGNSSYTHARTINFGINFGL
ncbi:SusC/RagA family TonB-linked outer membrane protein [Sphingobacterium daejeonense]|jgi:TonB-linked SusC/RagA family outer membrane protein|uniref:SusC/RagA family TonB-linked outer membrane protein n=1 Tax=Sphingobacterium daejeonense TaxID=371142 RepID=UPI003D32206C